MNGPLITLEDGWAKLKSQGVLKIQEILEDLSENVFRISITTEEYSSLYTTVYSMCTQKPPNNWSEQLYHNYCASVKEYLSQKVLPRIKAKSSEAMLRELVRRWENHKLMVRFLSHVFKYLDRFYVKRLSLPELSEVGSNSFHEIVFNSVKKDVRAVILALILKEREGDQVDRKLIKDVVSIFVDMGGTRVSLDVYTTDFEEALLVATRDFYRVQSASWTEQDSFPDYMAKAEDRLTQEQARVGHFLHPSTEEKLLQVCEDELLSLPEAKLLEKEHSGCEALLRDNKTDDLARMYRLFSRVITGLQPIGAIVRKHIADVGMALVRKQEVLAGTPVKGAEPADGVEITELAKQAAAMAADMNPYVQELLDIHDKYQELVKECFGQNTIFQKAMKEAFEQFVNKDIHKVTTAEMLSNFCDNLLKKSGERLDEQQLDDKLEKVVRLFSYLTDKDIFAEFYKKQLAKRLLLQRSASDDAERSMIAKLKLKCGAQFTSKLEGMVLDMNLSQDHQTHFIEFISMKEIKLECDLTVQVLTTGFWPTYKSDELNLPSEMVACVTAFKAYYDSKTSHRRLRWVHNLGSNQVLGTFYPGGKKKQHDLMVSTYQACILLLFNTQEKYTCEEMQKALNMPIDELKRYMLSLSLGKYRILHKTPASKEVASADVFSVNNEFTDRARRIKVPMLTAKVTVEEKESTRQTVDEDRKHAIEAAIVRIMKTRKTLDHQKLVLEASQQLMRHFKPDPKLIKKRIEVSSFLF